MKLTTLQYDPRTEFLGLRTPLLLFGSLLHLAREDIGQNQMREVIDSVVVS